MNEALAKSAASFGNYPAITGTEDWRQAAADWLNRRFVLNGAIDPEKHVLPLNGTREGLFSVLFPFMPRDQGGRAAHRGDAQSFLSVPMPRRRWAAGAEPLYVAGRLKANGFLPDYAGLPEATLERLAAVYICSPSNPEGAAAERRLLAQSVRAGGAA